VPQPRAGPPSALAHAAPLLLLCHSSSATTPLPPLLSRRPTDSARLIERPTSGGRRSIIGRARVALVSGAWSFGRGPALRRELPSGRRLLFGRRLSLVGESTKTPKCHRAHGTRGADIAPRAAMGRKLQINSLSTNGARWPTVCANRATVCANRACVRPARRGSIIERA